MKRVTKKVYIAEIDSKKLVETTDFLIAAKHAVEAHDEDPEAEVIINKETTTVVTENVYSSNK